MSAFLDHPEIVAHLSPEDLRRWRTVASRLSAIEDGGAARYYNRDEIEETYRQRYVLWEEFIDRYGLIDSPYLCVSGSHGACYYDKRA